MFDSEPSEPKERDTSHDPDFAPDPDESGMLKDPVGEPKSHLGCS